MALSEIAREATTCAKPEIVLDWRIGVTTGRGWCIALKTNLFIAIGAVIALIGALWTLQGLGVVGGSVMSGVTLWAIVGPVVAIAGVVLVIVGVRGRKDPRSGR